MRHRGLLTGHPPASPPPRASNAVPRCGNPALSRSATRGLLQGSDRAGPCRAALVEMNTLPHWQARPGSRGCPIGRPAGSHQASSSKREELIPTGSAGFVKGGASPSQG